MELREINSIDKEILLSEDKELGTRFEAPLMQVDKINRNGRIYPEATVRLAIRQANKAIDKTSMYGSSSHPSDGIGEVSDVAFKINKFEYRKEDKQVWISGQIFSTQRGNDLKTILKSGGRLGLSVRGFGITKEISVEGAKVKQVESPWKISGADFCLSPAFDSHMDKANLFESVQLPEVTVEHKVEVLKDIFKDSYELVKDNFESFEEFCLDYFGNDEEALNAEIKRVVKLAEKETKGESQQEREERAERRRIYEDNEAYLSGSETVKKLDEIDEKTRALFDEAVASGWRGSLKDFEKAMSK